MHTRTRRTLIALVSGALLLLGAAPAGAARADAPVTIPAGSSVFVVGHGWGHGIGMSQYGARGAALQGQSYRQILDFYYPGTAVTSLSTSIKVLITGDTDNNLTVYHQAGLRVRDLGNGHAYKLRTHRTPKVWRLVQKNGHTKVFYKTSHWHLYKTAGRRSLIGDGEFRAPGGLTLKLPTGPRKYRGALRFTNTNTVNVLSLEKYVRGVIGPEMPPSWPAEALRAQAVAARTYAARERADNANDYYNICDTTACQVYRGVVGEADSTNAAAAATAGQVLTYAGQYALAQFSSSNGGWAAVGNQPYLQSKQDQWTSSPLAADPNLNWSKELTATALQAAYPQVGTPTKLTITARNGGGTWETGGRVVTLSIEGTAGSVTGIDGGAFSSKFGLKSRYFKFALTSAG